MDIIRTTGVTCDQVTMKIESDDPKKDGVTLWTDPNAAVEMARELLIWAREAGATNIDEVFPEFDGQF
jgi:hypothetical protein